MQGVLHDAIGIKIKKGTIKVEGDLDFRALGLSKEVPVGFKEIRLKFIIVSDAPLEKLESLQKLAERYCLVYQTLVSGTPI